MQIKYFQINFKRKLPVKRLQSNRCVKTSYIRLSKRTVIKWSRRKQTCFREQHTGKRDHHEA